MPSALASLYTDIVSVRSLLSSEGVDLRLDDDESGTVDGSETTLLTTDAVNYSTAQVNLYLAGRYSPSRMASDWNVHRWATVLAAVWLCERRGNPAPDALAGQKAEAVEEMMAVRNRQLDLAETGERVEELPSFSNGTLANGYRLRQWRVQRPLSSSPPGGPPQATSYPAEVYGPIEQR